MKITSKGSEGKERKVILSIVKEITPSGAALLPLSLSLFVCLVNGSWVEIDETRGDWTVGSRKYGTRSSRPGSTVNTVSLSLSLPSSIGNGSY